MPATITATGVHGGLEITVVVALENSKLTIYIPGCPELDSDYQRFFEMALDVAPPVGGTYWPPRNSIPNASSALSYTFFDTGTTPKIEIDGKTEEIPQPGPPGVVY